MIRQEPRNLLFVLYGDLRGNSAGHVHSLARELSQLNFSCAVAIPSNKETASEFPTATFETVLYEELETGQYKFPNGQGPDIVHAWTPREGVRRFCERLADRYTFRQFVHMEDNEWHLLASLGCVPWEKIQSFTLEQLDSFVPVSLSHPVRGMEFMRRSKGLTLIVERLKEVVPAEPPSQILWPSAQNELFFPRPLPKTGGSQLGIPAGYTVLVYPGNVHPANSREVRSLYLAVAMLNREGFPAKLVRAGGDYCPFLGSDESWAREHSIELGPVSRHAVAPLLSLADVLVQPGQPDVFNDYRFPSKLPEFLSIGRPVIVPESNVALHMEHGKHAWILKNANAVNIGAAVRTIMGDPVLYKTLAAGSVEFYKTRLSWKRAARSLADFYTTGSAQP